MPRVSVIVVTWNGAAWLQRCLPALADSRFTDFELVVVDNGSSDPSVAVVRRWFPSAVIIQNRRNRGFAAANNQGFAASRAPYCALLNNDAIVEPNWLGELVTALDSDPTVGLAASRLLRLDNPERIDSAGLSVDLLGFGWNIRDGRLAPPEEPPRDVFGAPAAAALVRRAMVESIGVFDEDFESYYEDVDLSWRAQLRGWRCRYVPTAQALHAHSATGQRIGDRKAYLLGRNHLWTVVKNYPASHVRRIIPMLALAEVAGAAQGWLRRSSAAARGRWDAIMSLPQALAKRRVIQAKRVVSWESVLPLLIPPLGRPERIGWWPTPRI